VQAVDPYGRADGNHSEVCIDPSQGDFFAGCSVARTPTSRQTQHPWRLALGAAGLAGAVWFARRRRRAK
jgi:LPXTG-motif cell wall-anchored protein